MQLSHRNENIARHIVEHTNFCPVKSLSNEIDEKTNFCLDSSNWFKCTLFWFTTSSIDIEWRLVYSNKKRMVRKSYSSAIHEFSSIFKRCHSSKSSFHTEFLIFLFFFDLRSLIRSSVIIYCNTFITDFSFLFSVQVFIKYVQTKWQRMFIASIKNSFHLLPPFDAKESKKDTFLLS